ncbi:MAG: sugar transferase [Cyanobacteria bacterium J06628_4]
MIFTTSLQPLADRLSADNRQLVRPLFTSRQIAASLLICDIAILLASLQTLLSFQGSAFILLLSPLPWLFVITFVSGLYLADTYRLDRLGMSGVRASIRTLVSNSIATGLWVIVIYICNALSPGAAHSNNVWPTAILIFSIWTIISRVATATYLKAQTVLNRWLLLGFDRSQQSLLQDFRSLELTNNVVNLLATWQTAPAEHNEEVGDLSDLGAWLTQPWSHILVSDELKLNERQLKYLKQARLQGMPVYRVPDLYENYFNKIPANTLQDTWFTFSVGFNLLSNRINLWVKRFGDIILAVSVLCIVSPIMLITAIAIKLDSPGSVFYRQSRTGQNMKPFQVYKFRSMYQDAEKRGVQWASERDPRITRVGNFIRLVRIDELPQLWNVLRGDMSMMGPRPERPEFDEKLAKEIPHYTVRYVLKPGITGWAQVLYPYGASVNDAYEKLAYDLYYIKNHSFWLDLAIVFKTLRVVLLGKGR